MKNSITGECGQVYPVKKLAATEFQWANLEILDGTTEEGWKIGLSYNPANAAHTISAFLPDKNNTITVTDAVTQDQLRFVGLSTVKKIVSEPVPTTTQPVLPVGSVVNWSPAAIYMKKVADPPKDYLFSFLQKVKYKNGKIGFIFVQKTKNY